MIILHVDVDVDVLREGRIGMTIIVGTQIKL